MTEHEYVSARNLGRIDAALALLRQVTADDLVVQQPELDHLVGQLAEWQEALLEEAVASIEPEPEDEPEVDGPLPMIDLNEVFQDELHPTRPRTPTPLEVMGAPELARLLEREAAGTGIGSDLRRECIEVLKSLHWPWQIGNRVAALIGRLEDEGQ